MAKHVPVVAVLNMKGGVGKTTLSSNVFRQMFSRKRLGVLLLDLDPQFNLTQTLFTREDYERLKNEGKTIFSVMEPPSDVGLFEVKTTDLPPPKVAEISKTFRYFGGSDPIQQLSIVPGDFRLVKYSLMNHTRKLAAVQQRFQQFVNEAKEHYGVICIDCNPSSSFLTMCALQACTHLLVPVRPDRYSILGLEMLWEFVGSIPALSKKPQLIVVLNGISRTVLTSVEEQLRGHPVFGTKTLAAEVAVSTLLHAKTDYTGFGTDKKVSWSSNIRSEINKVADELALRLGIK